MMIWSESETAGITVTVPDQAALLADLERCFQSGQGFSVATLNLDHVVKLSRNKAFRAAYGDQTHITADGNPIVWLSRLAGQDVSLVPGSELISPVADLAARHQVPVALFGATDEALAAAAAALSQQHPGLDVVLCRAPAMGFDPLADAAAADIAAIEASGARLCFLALGAPKQEIFAARARSALPGTGFVSIGAGLDFIAGTQTRAPAWVQAVAAEWLWRLLGSPRRLAARYGACFLVLPKLTGRALLARRQSGKLS
ncbi:WecB/TagA/CpsF family glycosyltransferase [Roseobacter sp. EG26]|uniref:WecB/TagA/CpsF family glycosyltransferase n=1 Tax=Roseobacter sp. EG26 TaxID=3412477 RepID=UPI003CE58162